MYLKIIIYHKYLLVLLSLYLYYLCYLRMSMNIPMPNSLVNSIDLSIHRLESLV